MTYCHMFTNLVSNKVFIFALSVAKDSITLVCLAVMVLTLLMCAYTLYYDCVFAIAATIFSSKTVFQNEESKQYYV